MKEQILKLRKEGKTYNEIVKIIGCSKSTVSYYCGEGQKEKSRDRQIKNRKTLKNKFFKKVGVFTRNKIRNFKRGNPDTITKSNSTYLEFFEKILKNPVCYLTGDIIDLENTSSYELDHILPYSKGGNYEVSNMGLTTRDANRCKSDLLHEELIEMCIKILKNNNYKITK